MRITLFELWKNGRLLHVTNGQAGYELKDDLKQWLKVYESVHRVA